MGKLDLKPIPNSFCIRIAARDEYNSMRLYLSTDAKSVTGLYLAELPEHNIHHILETRYTLEQVIRWTDEGTWSVSAGHTEYKRAKQAYLKSKIKNRLSGSFSIEIEGTVGWRIVFGKAAQAYIKDNYTTFTLGSYVLLIDYMSEGYSTFYSIDTLITKVNTGAWTIPPCSADKYLECIYGSVGKANGKTTT